MPLVAIESPLRATDAYSREQFKRYWQFCIEDALVRGELPYSSHWLAEILDDDNPRERALGIHCGLTWSSKCDYAAYYCDFGVSQGMKDAIDFYRKINKRVERRTLGYDVAKIIHEMGEATDGLAQDPQDMTDFS
jgi:hypothetical protein